LRLLWQVAFRAISRAWAKTGKRMAARMAMIAMTTSSSMSVKPRRPLTTGTMGGLPSIGAGRRSDQGREWFGTQELRFPPAGLSFIAGQNMLLPRAPNYLRSAEDSQNYSGLLVPVPSPA